MKWILCLPAALLLACGTATDKTVQPSQTDKPKEPTALLNNGLEAYKHRKYKEARSFLQETLRSKTDKHHRLMALKHLAFMDALENNIPSAKKHFLDAFATDKNFELDKSEYGNPVWTPVFEEARIEFHRGLYTGEDWYREGVLHYRERRYTEALFAFDKALSHTNFSKDQRLLTYKYQGFIYSIQKQTQKAKEAFRKAFEANKNFKLEPSEYGNPLWTPLYEEVKKEFHK